MAENELAGVTALVTGASRGFGQGIATALSGAGAHVVGVARAPGPPEELRAQLGDDDGQAAYMVTPAGLSPLP